MHVPYKLKVKKYLDVANDPGKIWQISEFLLDLLVLGSCIFNRKLIEQSIPIKVNLSEILFE